MMRIPVFVSCPTSLNPQQDAARAVILAELKKLGLEPRALGRSDYPTDYPLREVAIIAQHCSGGVILGFEQFYTDRGTWKRGSAESKSLRSPVSFPTAWNHLEAGVLFSLHLPLLVFKEPNVSGGVFDSGVTDVFIHKMPVPPLKAVDKKGLGGVFLKWQSKVREHYYRTHAW
ncbi:MAG: hypothetical protein ABSD98_11020 [Candidatus Korobacteraceae bacterium]|jgi:hypothetical protein